MSAFGPAADIHPPRKRTHSTSESSAYILTGAPEAIPSHSEDSFGVSGERTGSTGSGEILQLSDETRPSGNFNAEDVTFRNVQSRFFRRTCSHALHTTAGKSIADHAYEDARKRRDGFRKIVSDKELFQEVLQYTDFPTRRRLQRVANSWKLILTQPPLNSIALLSVDTLFSLLDDSALFKILLEDFRILSSSVQHVICDFRHHSEIHAFTEFASMRILLTRWREVHSFTAVRLNMDGSCWQTICTLPRTLRNVAFLDCRSFERTLLPVNGDYRRFHVQIPRLVLPDFSELKIQKRHFRDAFEGILWPYPYEQVRWIEKYLPRLTGQNRADAALNLEYTSSSDGFGSFSGSAVSLQNVNFDGLTSSQLYHLAACIVTQRRPVLPSPPQALPHFSLELPEDVEDLMDFEDGDDSDSDKMSELDDEWDEEESDKSPAGEEDLLDCKDHLDYDARDAIRVVRLAMHGI